MRRTLLALAAVLAAATALGALVMLRPGSPPPVPRHIVLISLDTLRADTLGFMGHERVVTPHLDALAEQSVVFEQHISAAPTTLASHTALFTGTHPHTHGVPRNDHVVPDANVMLPEWLGEHGFTSAAFLGAMPLASHSAFTQGFDHVDEDFDLHRTEDDVAQTMRTGDRVTDAVLSWLGDHAPADDDRLFVFAHYFDVHSPYQPPERFREPYDLDDVPRRAGSMRHIAITRHHLEQGRPAATAQGRILQELYLAGITHVDHEVGRLLDGLAEAGILDDALVIVTADHGETFTSHPEEIFNHGYTVFDETVHTPLVMRFPGGWGAGRRVGALVSSIDVLPTLAEILDLPAPTGRPLEGLAFTDHLRGDGLAAARPPVFAEATKPHFRHPHRWQNAPMRKAIRTDDHKLVLHPRANTLALYDLSTDPGELTDVRTDAPAVTATLREQLLAWRQSADPLDSPRVSNARVKAELEALGYLSDDEDDDAPADDTDGGGETDGGGDTDEGGDTDG